jgi:thiol-disulfide isomerase/thioredoxin
MMRLKSTILLIAVVIIVLLIAACSSGPEATGPSSTQTTPDESTPESSTTIPTAPRVNFLAPGFELETLDGRSVALESLQGKYVMLNFWATWCGPCRHEMPFFQQIFEDEIWADRGLVIAAVNIGESAALAGSFMDYFELDFMVLLDSRQQVARVYNVSAIPTTFFIDKDGIIRDIRIGTFAAYADLEQQLENLLSNY